MNLHWVAMREGRGGQHIPLSCEKMKGGGGKGEEKEDKNEEDVGGKFGRYSERKGAHLESKMGMKTRT